MNRKTLFAALVCALLVFSMLGCETTNHLQSIQLKAVLINGVATTSQSGTVTLLGNGGTIQLSATGQYSSGKSLLLHGEGLVYTAAIDPQWHWTDTGGLLVPPCEAPSCPAPSTPPYTSGTVEYSQTGLITAVEPAVCTWVNSAVDPSTTPAWSYVGDYVITASYQGITSQPFYVPIASAVGVYDQYSNPTGACGPG